MKRRPGGAGRRLPVRPRFLIAALALLLFFVAILHRLSAPIDAAAGVGGGADELAATPGGGPRKTFVIASLKDDDTEWLYTYFPDWDKRQYVVNDPEAALTVPANKGRESMVYLTFIIDNYENLPPYMLFIHSYRWQWHNDDPIYDGVPPLKNFQIPYLEKEGYVNLRCVWVLGCPSEIKPIQEAGHHREQVHAGDVYAEAFGELFPGKPVPDVVGVSCCAQFAASRAKILERPKSDYEHYRNWLLNSPLEDAISGRILEYSWHMIFGKEPVYCPRAEDCYCNVFGLCDLNCPKEDSCEGRYQLPPYSTLPQGWPEKGWNGEETNRSAEY
ncbi:hypothetical protein BDY21DRAFT_287988 [Lineolata rhizophorae]|uniref:Uncharacterized protein n=1 Tax=Lineolata rhizophorae TaxID=578093 RepID=A0A6A6NZ07_9PEZI|nr:hypothetical protein BDY21DRAFT_287988 [Lineolata rhizophorae]